MPKLRGLVVDDAVMMRRLISMVLETDARIEVAGIAANGSLAIQKLTQLNPDFVTLDVEMPEMDGLATLRALRQTHPRLPVIMLSLATQRGAIVTLDALAAGASDYVTKPQNVANLDEAIALLQRSLLPKVHALCGSGGATPAPPALPVAVPSADAGNRRGFPSPLELICLATSTGGPNALSEIFAALDCAPPVPIAIVQHMPEHFTRLLAERIDRAPGAVRCSEALDGERLEPGRAYLAPGGRHLAIERRAGHLHARLLDTPPENSCRPSADVLFRSAAAAVGGGVLAVVLTGMGSDGARGAAQLHEAGATILAQDEATSVVWGMPGAVVRAGLADDLLPLARVAPAILRRARGAPPVAVS
ncbi:MAG: protein-glutamate methylesterase/protein-glutamine glutaminase [Verrucomicrobiota bacterium]